MMMLKSKADPLVEQLLQQLNDSQEAVLNNLTLRDLSMGKLK